MNRLFYVACTRTEKNLYNRTTNKESLQSMTSKDLFKGTTYNSLEEQVGVKALPLDENSTCRVYKRKQLFLQKVMLRIYLATSVERERARYKEGDTLFRNDIREGLFMKTIFKPQTEWVPPESFPDLSKYDEIAIDLRQKTRN